RQILVFGRVTCPLGSGLDSTYHVASTLATRKAHALRALARAPSSSERLGAWVSAHLVQSFDPIVVSRRPQTRVSCVAIARLAGRLVHRREHRRAWLSVYSPRTDSFFWGWAQRLTARRGSLPPH